MKMGKLNKAGVILLVVSFLLWAGAIACIFVGYGELLTNVGGWEDVVASTQLLEAELIILSSAAMPIFFAKMFSAQAKDKTGGMVTSAVLLAAWLVYAYKDVAEMVLHGATGNGYLANLLAGLVVPVLAILAILLSNRPMAILAAILSLAAAVVGIQNASNISSVLTLNGAGYTSSSVLQVRGAISTLPIIAEIIYGLGMFFGLLGVKKHGKTVD